MTESKFLNKFSYKYLIESKFMEFIDITDKMEIIKEIIKFLRVSSLEKIYQIDSGAYYKSKNDKPELLLLWLEKYYKKQNIQKLL